MQITSRSLVSLFYQQAIKRDFYPVQWRITEAMVNPQDIQRLNKKMLETWMMNTARTRDGHRRYLCDRAIREKSIWNVRGRRWAFRCSWCLRRHCKRYAQSIQRGVKELLTNMPALRDGADTQKVICIDNGAYCKFLTSLLRSLTTSTIGWWSRWSLTASAVSASKNQPTLCAYSAFRASHESRLKICGRL